VRASGWCALDCRIIKQAVQPSRRSFSTVLCIGGWFYRTHRIIAIVYYTTIKNMGKQVYISDEHHRKLKLASAERGEQMGKLVEEYIEQMNLMNWNDEIV